MYVREVQRSRAAPPRVLTVRATRGSQKPWGADLAHGHYRTLRTCCAHDRSEEVNYHEKEGRVSCLHDCKLEFIKHQTCLKRFPSRPFNNQQSRIDPESIRFRRRPCSNAVKSHRRSTHPPLYIFQNPRKLRMDEVVGILPVFLASHAYACFIPSSFRRAVSDETKLPNVHCICHGARSVCRLPPPPSPSPSPRNCFDAVSILSRSLVADLVPSVTRTG